MVIVCLNFFIIRGVHIAKKTFPLHMHAKTSFAHLLQTAKMGFSRTSAQNNGPRAQNNGSRAQNIGPSAQNNGPRV